MRATNSEYNYDQLNVGKVIEKQSSLLKIRMTNI